MRRLLVLIALVAMLALAAGCGDDTSPTLSPTQGNGNGASPTVPSGESALTLSEPDADGNVAVTINRDVLAPLFYGYNDADPNDTFYQIHTEQDDLYLSIELYLIFGDGWTGQLGTFDLDCDGNGICVYLDIDGTGTQGILGPATVGQITIDKFEDGYDVTLGGVSFTDSSSGTVYTLAGLTLTG